MINEKGALRSRANREIEECINDFLDAIRNNQEKQLKVKK